MNPLKIVQIGDSFAAGTGNRNDLGLMVEELPVGCQRSPTNWGARYADSLRDRYDVTYINRACSNAQTDNIDTTPQLFNYIRMGDLNRRRCPNTRIVQHPEVFYEQVSDDFCGRFLELQTNGIDPTVDLVLLMIGGNDIDFQTASGNCFFAPTRQASPCVESVINAEEIMGTYLQGTFARALRSIRDKMTAEDEDVPSGRVVFVDYPYIPLEDDTFILEDDENVIAPSIEFRRVQYEISLLQEAAAQEVNEETGFEFVIFHKGLKELFAGHEMDPTARVNRDAWMLDAIGPRLRTYYHPNRKGQLEIAEFMAAEGAFGL